MMNTYVRNTTTNQIARINQPVATTKKMISTGFLVGYEIVKSTKKLSAQAELNITVKCCRVLATGKLGYL